MIHLNEKIIILDVQDDAAINNFNIKSIKKFFFKFQFFFEQKSKKDNKTRIKMNKNDHS